MDQFSGVFFIFGDSKRSLEFFYGFSTACVIGVILGYFMGMYKWVDEDGRVHYSDVIPPQRVDKGHSVVDKDGVVVTTVDAVKQGAALKQQKDRQAQERQARERAHQKVIHDRQLIDTYDTRDQLIEVRNQRLATIDGALTIAAAHIDRLKEHHAELMKLAAQHEREGKSTVGSQKSHGDLGDGTVCLILDVRRILGVTEEMESPVPAA